MHGDGNLPGTTLAQVEIECEDCHGTVTKAPWELPLGYGKEHATDIADTPRGLTDELPFFMEFATVYEPQDGYLLTARGNPYGNVVKHGDKVILHSASGLNFEVPVLKTIKENDSWKSPNAMVAMSAVRSTWKVWNAMPATQIGHHNAMAATSQLIIPKAKQIRIGSKTPTPGATMA